MKQSLAIQIDKPFIRAALIQKGGTGLKICSLRSSLISEPNHVKQLYISHLKGMSVTGLSSGQLLIKSIELKIAKMRYLDQALHFQADNANLLNPIDYLFVPYLIKKTKGKASAYLCTASKEGLREHLADLTQLGLETDSVSSNDLALLQYVRWKLPSLYDAFIVDLGSSEWSCLWMEKGELKKSYCLAGGIEALLSCLWEDRKKILLSNEVEGAAKQIDLLQLKPHLNPHLSEKINQMRQELAKIIYFFHRTSKERPILFTGLVDSFSHLREFLILPFKEVITGETYLFVAESDHQKFAIPIGLALQQMEAPLQLRREEFFPKKNWKKAGLYALILIFLSFALSILFLAFEMNKIELRKKKMTETVLSMVEDLDSELKRELFKNEPITTEKWISLIQSSHKEYPYILRACTVSELLAWITTHPIIVENKNSEDPIDIIELRYQLVDYPKIGALQNRYQTKVDLQFSVKSPMKARKFHEALLNDHEMIDLSSEFGWEVNDECYHVTFFLKNHRTGYVP